MKKISGRKIIQLSLLIIVFAIYGNYLVRDIYGPIPDREIGFPIKPKWEITLNDKIRQVIVTENNHAIVRLGYSINSVSLETGEKLWKYRVDEPIYSIIAHEGKIYAAGKGSLYALDETTGTIKWQRAVDISTLSPEFRYADQAVIVLVSHGAIYIFDAQTGELRKSFYVGRGLTPTCIYKSTLYTFNDYIEAYNLENGEFLWEDKSTHYTYKAVCENDVAYFIQNDSKLIAYNMSSQSKLWSRSFPPTDPYTLNKLYITQDFLIIDGLSEMIVVSKIQGELIYKNAGQKQITTTALIGNNVYVFYSYDQAIYAYDINTWKNTGKLRYTLPTILSTDIDLFCEDGNQLIIWKNKHLFAYQ